MGVDSDDEDLVVYGTPIEREEDTSARKRRAVAEAGQLRALPAWKQEVFLSPPSFLSSLSRDVQFRD
jgi:G patch domain-containing protein 1